jgi:hypothetical protein
MPRWEGTPKYYYSPERLAYLREANREHRKKLRGGLPPMPFVERGRMGAKIMLANRRNEIEAEAQIARRGTLVTYDFLGRAKKTEA